MSCDCNMFPCFQSIGEKASGLHIHQAIFPDDAMLTCVACRRIEAALGMHIYPATFLNEGVDESEEPSQESWEAGEEASEADESPQEGDGNATTAQETQGQNSSEAPNATDAEPVASVESDGNSTGAEAASVEEEAGAGGNGTAAAFSRFRQRLAAKAAQVSGLSFSFMLDHTSLL